MSISLAPREGTCARFIYDAFLAEAKKSIFMANERQAVYEAATAWAEMFMVESVTMAQVENAEKMAMGHVDYAAKWAYYVAELLEKEKPCP